MRKRYEDAAVEIACNNIRTNAITVQSLIGPAGMKKIQFINSDCSECDEIPTFQHDIEDYHSERRWSVEIVRVNIIMDELKEQQT